MDSRSLRLLLRVAASIGLLVSAKLLIHFVSVNFGFQQGPSECAFSDNFDCDKVALSPSSTLLGVPIAAWSISYYLLIAFVSVGELKPARVRYLTGFGALFSVWMSAQSFFVVGSVCVYCTMLYGLNLFLFLFLHFKLEKSSIISQFINDIRFSEWTLYATVVLGFVVALPRAVLVDGFLSQQTIEILSDVDRKVRSVPASKKVKLINQYKSEQLLQFRPSVITRGPDNAPLHIVEFSDFQCPACASFSRTLSRLVEDYPEKLKVSFYHFPLDKKCNPGRWPAHEQACLLGEIATCAGENFWDVHDAIFALKSYTSESINSLRSGVDQSCLDSGAGAAVVASDIELARSLGVRSTPSVFLNGRGLRDRGYSEIKVLFEYLLSDEQNI